MDELLAAAAAALNAPAAMVERSAQARAKADGVSVESVLAAWSGGTAVVAAPTAETPAAPTTPEAPAAPAAAAPAVPAVDPTDEASLIAAAAEKMGMPESMIKRSAAARAKASGSDERSILLEWAGVDPSAAPAAEPAAPAAEPAAAAAPPAPETPAAAPAPAQPAAGGALDEAALLAAAAEKMGMPESMVKRSAGARAKATGTDVAAVLAEWAGLDPAAAAAPATAPDATAAAAPVAAAPAAPQPAASAPAAALDVEVLGSPDEPVAADSDEPDESDEYESEDAAAAAGALPRWLAALFVIIPAFAIGYALFLPNGPNCGDAGSLAVDPVTGLAVNCDGSEYGVEEVDLFTLGSEIYSGIGCAACHGANGGGVANFPAFTGGALLTTFPQDWCDAQIEWIALGTTGWPEATYGATEKPVGGSGGVMPGFAGVLTPEEIAAVTLYERVAYGGQDLDAATAECSPAGGDATTAALGE